MRRALTALALLLVAGCSDLVSPRRDGIYEYRLFRPATGGGLDTLSFHWPREFLPVKVWVADASPLRDPTTTAVARWQAAFLYGEFRAVMVSDSNQADIIVRNQLPPVGSDGLLVERLDMFAPQCRGETDYFSNTETMTVALPIRIYVWNRFATETPETLTCYRLTMTHELGHAIGLLEHSTNPGDIMLGDPVVDAISDRDRETVETVYHLRSTLTPVRR